MLFVSVKLPQPISQNISQNVGLFVPYVHIIQRMTAVNTYKKLKSFMRENIQYRLFFFQRLISDHELQ